MIKISKTKTYVAYAVAEDFAKHGEFLNKKGLKRCFICNKEFKNPEEVVGVVFIKGKGGTNKLVCKDCARLLAGLLEEAGEKEIKC